MDRQSENFDYMFKIILVGSTAAGKTNLCLRFTRNKFLEEYKVTLGAEFTAKYKIIEGKSVKIQLWDTTGEEKYRAVSSMFYRGAAGALLVYDVTSRKSFEDVTNWIEQIRTYSDTQNDIVLVGNKIDKESDRAVSFEEAKNFANENQLYFSEASALTGENVENIFEMLIQRIYQKAINSPEIKPSSHKSSIKVSRQNSQNKKKCC